MIFKKGRYYLVNGFKAEIQTKSIVYRTGSVDTITYYGRVLIPHNIWVPTMWNSHGNSADPAFNLKLCVENREQDIMEWESGK